MRALGYGLIIAGLLALIYGGFTYTKRDTVLGAAAFAEQSEPAKSVTVRPSLAGLAVLAGAMLVFSGRRPV